MRDCARRCWTGSRTRRTSLKPVTNPIASGAPWRRRKAANHGRQAAAPHTDSEPRGPTEMNQQGGRPGYGNWRAMETVEKQTAFFPRSHSAWKTRPNADFSTVTTAPTAGTYRNQNNENLKQERSFTHKNRGAKSSHRSGPNQVDKATNKGLFDVCL